MDWRILVNSIDCKLHNAIMNSNVTAVRDLLTTHEEVLDIERRTYAAAYYAAVDGETECLRVIATKGITLLGDVSEGAVMGGHVPCLRLAREFGDRWSSELARTAVCEDSIDCLNFLIENGCPLDDRVVEIVVYREYFESLRLLVDRGFPETPFGLSFVIRDGEPITPGQWECLHHLLDHAREIHQGTLIYAARGGDVESVRLLHSRGVGLWEAACKEEDLDFTNYASNTDQRDDRVIAIPPDVEHAHGVMQALHYGWAQGAPVTPALEAVFHAKRAATRAVLLCFRAAARLSEVEGSPGEQRATWSAMASVPPEIIETILLTAAFEIGETVRRRLPEPCFETELDAQPPLKVWKRNDDN